MSWKEFREEEHREHLGTKGVMDALRADSAYPTLPHFNSVACLFQTAHVQIVCPFPSNLHLKLPPVT